MATPVSDDLWTRVMKNNQFSRCKALVVTHAMVLTVTLTACKPTSTPEKIEDAKQATVYTGITSQELNKLVDFVFVQSKTMSISAAINCLASPERSLVLR